MTVLFIILALILIFIAVLLIRTIRFVPPKEVDITEKDIELDSDKIVSDLSDMIKCRTVSNRDWSQVDITQYDKFVELIRERFPVIFDKCSFEKVGKTGLLFFLKGEDDSEPSVCMAHYDVVPVEQSEWSVPAFDGLIKDGFIWGRGTLDTKGTLVSILEALELKLSEGYVPKHDLYLSFSGEEEIDGDSCADIVSTLEQRGVHPAMVLDEGGAVVNNVFPGVTRECAVVGIGEKGSVSMDLILEENGGHASTPPPHSVLGQLSKAVDNIENHPFKRQLCKPVAQMFDTLGRYSNFTYRLIFANLWCFAPILDMICKKSGGELNALMRTTVAVTRMEGSKAYNVLPHRGRVGINVRLLGEDTIDSAMDYLNKVIDNPKIKLELVGGMNPSIHSDTDCEGWEKVAAAIRETWTEAIVCPYMMLACSDSRHYCRITDKVYRFSAMRLSKEERGMIHGVDERIPIDTLLTTVKFYVRLLEKL